MSKKTTGGVSHSLCIAYFSAMGQRVSLPIFDDAPYDLIVDDGNILKKIQCKTALASGTTRQKRYPHISFYVDKHHSPIFVSSFDDLWVITNQFCYLIPSSEINHNKDGQLKAISMTPKYATFIVDMPFLNKVDPERAVDTTPLTDKEKRRIESLYQLKESARSIAMIMGLTINKVQNYLSTSGTFKSHLVTDEVKDQVIRMRKNGNRVGDIALAVGFSRQTVTNIVHDANLSKTPVVIKDEWKKDILQMYKNGKTPSEISAIYGTRPNAVSGFIFRSKWMVEHPIIDI